MGVRVFACCGPRLKWASVMPWHLASWLFCGVQDPESRSSKGSERPEPAGGPRRDPTSCVLQRRCGQPAPSLVQRVDVTVRCQTPFGASRSVRPQSLRRPRRQLTTTDPPPPHLDCPSRRHRDLDRAPLTCGHDVVPIRGLGERKVMRKDRRRIEAPRLEERPQPSDVATRRAHTTA